MLVCGKQSSGRRLNELGLGFCCAKAVLSALLKKRKVNSSFLLVSLKGRTCGSHPSHLDHRNKNKAYSLIIIAMVGVLGTFFATQRNNVGRRFKKENEFSFCSAPTTCEPTVLALVLAIMENKNKVYDLILIFHGGGTRTRT